MDKLWMLVLTGVAALGLTGCRGVDLPNWCCPGPFKHQQNVAERFDPHPENDVGPEVIGARPREYQKPVAEPLRARRLPWRRQ